MPVEITVPDIGDFTDVPVIEVHVKEGDTVSAEDPLITLESDKATMDVPAPQAGRVEKLLVKMGDRVSQGTPILALEAEGAAPTKPKENVRGGAAPTPDSPPSYGSASGAYETIDVAVPDIGDFKDVPIIEVHVSPGSEVKAEDPLITLESDKATMDVPSPAAGKVAGLAVKVGDRVSQGSPILKLNTGMKKERVATVEMPHAIPAAKPPTTQQGDVHAEVLVLGAGPGGYTAAFRAADLGKKVVIVERWPVLGGVCLNVGCIPSKALLHAAKVIEETHEMSANGLSFARPDVDVDKLRGWKDGVVKRLTGGLAGLAKARKVTVVEGVGKFVSLNQVEVNGSNGTKTVSFEQCIIAAGSEPVTLPFILTTIRA